MSSPPQGRPVVVEVSRRIHLMLKEQTINSQPWSFTRSASLQRDGWHRVHLQNEELGGLGFTPSLLQSGHRSHIHASYKKKTSNEIKNAFHN